MVRVSMTLVAERAQVGSLTAELGAIIMQARANQGLMDGHLSIDASDPCRIYYVEEWLTERVLREQLHSDRFRRLMGIMTSADHPRFDLQLCVWAKGADYVEEALEEYLRRLMLPRQ
jgi:quinol monooxygenase YgiN